MIKKFYSKSFFVRSKKRPIIISKDVMRFRVKISRKLKNYKAKLFRRYKRFTFLQKKFFKNFATRSRRRTDLLFLYKKPRIYSRWISKRYFSRARSRKFKKVNFFIKRIKEKYLRINNWRNRLRARYYKRTPKLYASSPFRYQLMDDNYNRKKFRIWINKRFFGKKKRFIFRIFYFFRKLEKIKFNFKTKSVPNSAAFDAKLFFEKYRKFSLWALTYSWHKFYPRNLRRLKRKIKIIKSKRKIARLRFIKKKKFSKIRLSKKIKKKNKKFVIKKNKKKYRQKTLFFYRRKYIKFKFNRRKFARKITYRRLRQVSRFLKVIRLAYKFPHNKRFFTAKIFRKIKKFKFFNFSNYSKKFFQFNKNRVKTFSNAAHYPRKFFKFYRSNTKQLFFTRKRLPKIFYKNFFYKKKLPLSYFFTRKSKKSNVYFKTFKKRVYFSRPIKFKYRSRVPFRIRRIINKLRFYLSRNRRSHFSKKINKKFFFVRRKYSAFLPYLGYFRKFGKKKFIYKKKRKKFFRFFRKFFRKFHTVSGIPTLRSKFYKTQASKVKFFIHVFRSVNNMFVNVSAPRGRTLYAYSAGRTHFRGSKRLSPVAIETMGKTVSALLKNSKIFQVGVVFHTPVNYLVRALMRGFRSNIKFTHFKYYMSKPHNGLRLRATRRI